MPASTPRWPDELPVNMTEAEYRALAEDISRSVEIVRGHIIRRESPAPLEQPVRLTLPISELVTT